VNLGDARIVRRLAEAGVKRHDQLELMSPRLGEVEARDCARAMQVHERRAAPRRQHDGVDTVDGESAALEVDHVAASFLLVRSRLLFLAERPYTRSR
jgi:hypothetical protein